MDEDSNCWFNAVIRGDVSPISIGKRVNIQDGAVIHGTLDKSETIIDDDASIGHNAIVHGAHVQSHALVGMGSIVMDGAVVGKGAVIAAGAVVLEGTHVPAGSLWAGVPAQERGRVSESLKQSLSETSNRYVRYSHWFK
jgi:carbonic anhydrase/acetyltransferase-like protein (isoleucine patch superfamily)|tara:strand:+ start:1022 stop:1438 length:417 start_codon:yes stop_codon:yes gene_type:complete